jgi:hypothetical protein
MARSNLMLERAAERAEFKKPQTGSFSCAHKDRRVFWRDILHGGMWSQPKKHAALTISIHKEPNYEHLRSKAQKRYGSRVANADELRIPRQFLPSEIKSLREALDKSRSILELKDNWDDAGSVGYSESTWIRTQGFLMKNALKLWRSHKTCFDPPKILAGPEGSIDLHWKSPNRELLINVPASSEEPIAYYGDDRGEGTKNAVRGKDLESSIDAEWIFLWLLTK